MFAAKDPAEPTRPGAPLLTATKDQSSGFVHLSWPQPGDGGSSITGYKIYRRVGTSGSFSLLTSVAGQTYDDTTTTLSGAYFYRVTAVNAQGEGPYAPEAQATIVVPPSPCSTPGVPVIVDLLDHGEDFDYST